MQGNTAPPMRSAGEPDDDLILPALPPLEADDEPSELLDPTELFQLSFHDGADEEEPEEFSHGIELPVLAAAGDDEPDSALTLDDAGLIQLPLVSEADEEEDDALFVGELVPLPAAEDHDDHEGPLETWDLDGATLPELTPEEDEDHELELQEELLAEAEEELVGLWPACMLSEQPSVAVSAGERLFTAGRGVWDLTQGEQLTSEAALDVAVSPQGVWVLTASGELWLSGKLVASGVRQLEPRGSGAAGGYLALDARGGLTLLPTGSEADPDAVKPPSPGPGVAPPALTRLGRRSYPLVALGSNHELLRSLDGGASWSHIVSEPAPVAWLRSSDLKLYARGSLLALGSERHGLALSSDGGLTFTELPLPGLTALTSGRPAGETTLLFVACYDPLLDEARIHAVDPLELKSRIIGVVRPRDAELDPRVRDLHYSQHGLVAAGDFGVLQLEPPSRPTDA